MVPNRQQINRTRRFFRSGIRFISVNKTISVPTRRRLRAKALPGEPLAVDNTFTHNLELGTKFAGTGSVPNKTSFLYRNFDVLV